MWFPRSLLRIPWTAKKTTEMVLKEAETNRSLVQKIRKQQATFFGHDVGSSRPRRLERHDRQRHKARHLIMMMMGAQNYPRCTNTIVKYDVLIWTEKPIISKYYNVSIPIGSKRQTI